MAVIKIQTGLRLEENLYNKLRILSQKEGRSLNNLMEFIAKKYVEDYELQNGTLPPLQN
ncbi:MAG: TraY domain-containing protein [Acutalibacter sp.]|jgi:hypothetical protein|uniref:ribbon-helix-helix domain-containing protein n=1 Tax=Acutalibacter sp. TaxID=1918636 RepID=UPI0013737FA3|nr:TraY domain-containing protein [Acutalibacter sp.]MCI9225021.1 TraY domain-containing protein [Acutalibacter sp.]